MVGDAGPVRDSAVPLRAGWVVVAEKRGLAPVVPAPVLQRLTERFVRGSSEASGTGLGLAIAKTIAQGVKARMTLASPATGRADGFEVTVQFLCVPSV